MCPRGLFPRDVVVVLPQLHGTWAELWYLWARTGSFSGLVLLGFPQPFSAGRCAWAQLHSSCEFLCTCLKFTFRKAARGTGDCGNLGLFRPQQ